MKKENNKKFLRFALSIVAALVLIFTGAFGGIYYSNNIAINSVIGIDVNPSIEITANKNDRVIEAVAINDDAKKVLKDMDLHGTDLNVAVNAIIGSMLKNGFLSTEYDGNILVSVKNNDQQKATILKEEILSEIKALLKANKVKADLINQTTQEDESADTFAKKHKISLGKAHLILGICEKDATLNPDKLAKMSISELSKVVDTKNIDITDIVDFDYDDSLQENIEDGIEDLQETTSKPQNKKQIISEERAKHIACEDAKVGVDKVLFKKVKLDIDDGQKYYDIEFSLENIDYDYEIDAYTGKILDKDINEDDTVSSIPNNAEVTESNVTSTESIATETGISEKKAKNIVLDHIGATAKDVVFNKAELEYDDSKKYYDIELVYNNYEYDYEISYELGKILEYSSERVEGYTSSLSITITREQAISLALNYATVSDTDARFESIEFNDEDGRSVYEIEFKANGYEYSCSVDANSGKIYDFEKEKDD